MCYFPARPTKRFKGALEALGQAQTLQELREGSGVDEGDGQAGG